jgi:glycosyltransferase domain-containing protein
MWGRSTRSAWPLGAPGARASIGPTAERRGFPSRASAAVGGAATANPTPRTRGAIRARKWSRTMSDAPFTLLIPTYDRPDLLVKLVRYYADSGFRHPIVVLDSSPEPARGRNRALLGQFDLDLTIREFDPATNPYAKFRDGVAGVTTRYCGLCADDDVVFVNAIEAAIVQLDRAPDCSAAHGVYFNMLAQGSTIEIRSVEQDTPGIDADTPLERCWQMLTRYSVLVYAVARREALLAAFERMASIPTVLFAELASAVSLALAGKIARLPFIHCGRSVGQSASYRGWHPHEIMAREPGAIFARYFEYREAIAPYVAAACPETGIDGVRRALDLMHMVYLRDFLDPRVLRGFYEDGLAGVTADVAVANYWRRWMSRDRSVHPVAAYEFANDAWFAAELAGGRADPVRGGLYHDFLLEGLDRSGTPRVYKLYVEFVFPGYPAPSERVPDRWVREIKANLDRYR